MVQNLLILLGVNGSVFYQFVLVAILYAALSITFLKPYQKLFQLREEKTSGAIKEAQELTKKAEDAVAVYSTKLKDVNGKIKTIFRSKEEEAKLEVSKILEAANAKARDKVQTAYNELDEQKSKLMEELKKEAVSLADEIAAKVLNRV